VKGLAMAREKAEIEILHARMIVFVGCTIAVTFALTVIGFVYGLLFVTQPLERSPNDTQYIDLLSTLTVFMTGTLSGLVASNGLKSKAKDTEHESK
jgi:hypothetical protein